jgi:predicted nucleic acid-binding protein
VAALVDTNVLVYRVDPRFPEKQARANELLRRGIAEDSLRVPHQAIVEFMAATTRPLKDFGPLLQADDARREAEELLDQFEILYPSDPIVRLALRGMAAYQLPWFDAHIWAYAEHHGLDELLSEDFQSQVRHRARHQSVRQRNHRLAGQTVPLPSPRSRMARHASNVTFSHPPSR